METLNIFKELFGVNFFSALISVILPLIFLILYALVAILGELKISAWIQERLGPMRTGPYGVLQPIAEVVKLIQKEDIIPSGANRILFNLAPYVIFASSFAGFAVIPFSSKFVPADINVGLFYVFAIGAFAVIGIVMGGWASNNKYSLLGAMRSAAQMISYEIPGAMVILSASVLANSLNLQEISKIQAGPIWNWFLFGGPGPISKIWIIPFTFLLAIIYMFASLAETNRTPFDIPEGESELVAGYHTEYSGMKFAMFFFAEYSNMFIVSAIMTIVFLGGWNSPFGDFMNGPLWGVFWFVGKAMLIVFIQIWIRWTLPRVRVDQLMFLGWKVLLPFSLVCFIVISLYRILY
ncbi:MAG: NADH-quinone oxidoreductase subunit NuoH [Candidatus Kapaibacteriales bacterium]